MRGELHRDACDGPARIERDVETGCTYKTYWSHGRLCRRDGPAAISHEADGRVTSERWMNGNEGEHRDPREGPAAIQYGGDGSIVSREYWINGRKLELSELFPLLGEPGHA
ncbi:MAG: hypothetical protein WDN31_02585 [Hyphomicrobium sp.]